MCLMKENPCCGEKIWWQLYFTEKKRASILQISQKNDFFFKRCRTTTNIYQIDSDLVWS